MHSRYGLHLRHFMHSAIQISPIESLCVMCMNIQNMTNDTAWCNDNDMTWGYANRWMSWVTPKTIIYRRIVEIHRILIEITDGQYYWHSHLYRRDSRVTFSVWCTGRTILIRWRVDITSHSQSHALEWTTLL